MTEIVPIITFSSTSSNGLESVASRDSKSTSKDIKAVINFLV